MKKVNKEIPLDTKLIDIKLEEYDKLREEAKKIKARMDTLSKEIKEYAEKHGVKDDKGSFYCDNGVYVFGKMAKKSVSFIKDKAIEFFKSRKLYDAVIVTEDIDENAVERYVTDGKVTFKDLEDITETKVTYAIDIKKKEELPIVGETEVKSAASKKSNLFKNLKKGG